MGAFEIWVCEMWMFGNLTAFFVGVSFDRTLPRQEVGREKQQRGSSNPPIGKRADPSQSQSECQCHKCQLLILVQMPISKEASTTVTLYKRTV
jgi:hypothetical protein